MSRVSYGTLLSGILTCNSETKSSILTKFLESKRSSMDNMLAKFRCLEIVAMETVTDFLFFFYDQYLSKGSRYCLEFWQFVLLDQRYILYLQHNFMRVADFCYNQAKFQPGSCGCQVSYGTLVSPILIYNYKTRNRIFTKFSANKRSSMEKMSAKFRCPEIVAMETVTDSFFLLNAQYLSSDRPIVLKLWEFVLQDQRYILCLEHNFLRLQGFLL